MYKQMENVRIQLTKENIDYIKSKGSFAKVVNLLVQEMKDDRNLEISITKKIEFLKNNK